MFAGSEAGGGAGGLAGRSEAAARSIQSGWRGHSSRTRDPEVSQTPRGYMGDHGSRGNMGFAVLLGIWH